MSQEDGKLACAPVPHGSLMKHQSQRCNSCEHQKSLEFDTCTLFLFSFCEAIASLAYEEAVWCEHEGPGVPNHVGVQLNPVSAT